MNHYPDHPGFQGKTETSLEAAQSIAPEAATLREQCVAALKNYGPMTADEVAQRLGVSMLSIRPRITELKRKGRIGESDERRLNRSGKKAVVVFAIADDIAPRNQIIDHARLKQGELL